jgi:hypothetical protein
MASISFLAKYTMFALIFVMVTGAFSNVFPSPSNYANASHPVAITAYAKASHTLNISPTNISSTLITMTTRHPTSMVNPAVDAYISLNTAQEEAEPYSCERAAHETAEIHSRRCSSVSAFFKLTCWGPNPINCCANGKGPTTCRCHLFWPEEAPRTLKTGLGPPDGTKCWVHR